MVDPWLRFGQGWLKWPRVVGLDRNREILGAKQIEAADDSRANRKNVQSNIQIPCCGYGLGRVVMSRTTSPNTPVPKPLPCPRPLRFRAPGGFEPGMQVAHVMNADL